MKTHHPTIEQLESRIAPASVVVMHDANGDVIRFTSSLGDLTGLVTSSGALPDGHHDQFTVNLTSTIFKGTNLSVTVTKGPHGDGHLANLIIDAGSNNLGNVSIAGDLGYITAGSGDVFVPAIKSLKVNSIGLFEAEGGVAERSSITGSLGKLIVEGGMDGTWLTVSQNIGSISIGGSLLGGTSDRSNDGDIFAGEAIGKVHVGQNVRGGDENFDGTITAMTTLGAVTVGGSVYGGAGLYSGSIGGGANVASVAIGGSIIGGEGEYSGDVYGAYNENGTVGKVTVGGSLVGGEGEFSGLIGYSNGGANNVSLTTVVIGKDIVGADGEKSGAVYANGGSIGTLTLKGSLIGGSNAGSGLITADQGAEAIFIGGSVYGGSGVASARIYINGSIDELSIQGSLCGGVGSASGEVFCSATIGVLNIHGNVLGGGGTGSGAVMATAVTTETIGGVVVPGTSTGSGTVTPA